MTFEFGGEIAWRPTPEYIDQSRLKGFMDRHGIATLADLQRRSIEDPRWFWQAVLEDLQIEFYRPYSNILDTSRGPAWPRWCVDGSMNIVHNCLDKWMGTVVETREVLRCEDEAGRVQVLTYRELWLEVNRCANALRALGIGKGDRVALFMPMCPELVAAFFAIIKIGGIVLPLFSGYGADAVASRLNDAEVAAVFVADGFWRRGQQVLMKPTADAAIALAPSVRHLIVASRIGVDVPMTEQRDHAWSALVSTQPQASDTEHTDADDPLMIIYTSGTTGRPKGALHTHCGFPIKTAQDMMHGLDLRESDTLYWVTDMGWMMGPWEVFGAALHGASMLFYDGALDYPGPARLWQLVQDHRATILGVSPTL